MQGIGAPQGKGRKGNGELAHRHSGVTASQSNALLFKALQWNQNGSFQSTLQDQDLHPYGTATACCMVRKLALTNSHGMQGHTFKHTCVSRGADRCMPGLTNTTQEPHFPAPPAELKFGDTYIVCNYRTAKHALFEKKSQQTTKNPRHFKHQNWISPFEMLVLTTKIQPQMTDS